MRIMGYSGGVSVSNFIFSGCDTVELAKKYGTPLYVMSEDHIRERCGEIKRDFINKYPKTKAVYASKAFLTKEMARIIKSEGLGMDVVSGGELYTAIKADFPMEDVIFHGNNKTKDELTLAIKNNVGRIVVDYVEELDLIEEIAKEYNKRMKILLRINPGLDIQTHKYIQTGQKDSKFGIPLDNIYEVLEKTFSLKYIDLLGFHFHLGSQILDNESYIMAVRIMADIMKNAKDKYGFVTKELNTGGGYGIPYTEEAGKDLNYFTDPIINEVDKNCVEYNLERPLVIIEPGRWIVGEAGITLYTIGNIKKIPKLKTYVSVDGGMLDNPRPSLYGAKYQAVLANKINEPANNTVTIAGKYCESGDILIWDLRLPKVESGDILVVFTTGAYNYSMSSNYNRIPRPAVVMLSQGKDRVIVKRETYEDIIRNDI